MHLSSECYHGNIRRNLTEITLWTSERHTLTHAVLTATLEIKINLEINKTSIASQRHKIVWRWVVFINLHGIVNILKSGPVWVITVTRVSTSERTALERACANVWITDFKKSEPANGIPGSVRGDITRDTREAINVCCSTEAVRVHMWTCK